MVLSGRICHTCSRPTIPTLVATFSTVPTPLEYAVCTSADPRFPCTTRELAQRSYLSIDGTSYKGPVDVHATCCTPRCTPELPGEMFADPAFFAALPSPVPTGTSEQPEEPIKIFDNNVGGIKAQAVAVATWLSVLQPDVVLLQEVWDMQRGIDLLPSSMMHFRSSAEGRATGFLTAWSRSLMDWTGGTCKFYTTETTGPLFICSGSALGEWYWSTYTCIQT